ncbi:MFS transporter [Deinococcus hopiensis]|uniref:Predicted arabinose efflux permease, MFS family n=1 Tax=Deinococcus hopiensis KR-140 TaxID=695939 RepID=A0A1W1VRV2_9DEIO|nr:MFS transporter [Deinococcus hopiensis]SMB96087.1 Predicted arabinose efflux permease, MFS family [Deinococcus hopiensis KR-140]
MTPLAASLRGVYRAYPQPFWVLWVGTLINRIGEFVVPLLGFYLTSERHMGISEVSLILSMLGVGRFVAEALSGPVSDRLGSTPTMMLALGGGAAVLLALPAAPGFGGLLLGALAFSLLTAMYKPAASSAVAAMTTGGQRTRAYNLLYWAVNVGTSVAPALGGWLSGFSFRLLFWLDAATMAAYALLLGLFGARNVRPGRKSGRGPSLLPRDALLWRFCLASLLFALTYHSYRMLALVFVQQGLTAVQYGQALSVNGLLVVGLGLPLGHVTSRSDHPRWQVWGAALLGAGFLIHAFAHTFALHVLAVCIWSLGEIVSYSIGKSITAELACPELRATYIGLVGSMSGLATLLAPLLGGFLLARYGNAPLWLTVAGLAFAAALVFWRLEGALEQRRGENEQRAALSAPRT